MLINFLTKIAAYGCIGWVIEIVFTGTYSLIRGNKKAVAITYLWMGPIYGAAGLVLEAAQDALPWPWYLKPVVYLPLIYGIEGSSGWIIKRITKSCPWDYGLSKWTPFGLIHLGYAPFWLALGLLFDPISGILDKIVVFLAKGY